MSQKNYNMLVVENLLRKDNHIRGLARELNTNQTTISRKIKELLDNNVVDYKQEGKNKAFFLKKTLETKQFVHIVELYKLLETLKQYPKLRIIFEKIRQNNKFKLAILFGSYAKGTANKESDIDIYIDTKDAKIKEEIALLDTKIRVVIGNYDKKNLLIQEIEKNHVVIKGVEEFYEKNQFFV